MKNLSQYLALLAVAGGLATVTARAEDDTPPPRHEHQDGPKLTDAEKAELKAAHEAADKDPAVIAAKAAFEAAKAKAKESEDPADRKAAREAGKALREAVKAAMIKADPGVAAILKKLPEHGPHGPRKGGDTPPPPPAPPAPAPANP